MIIEDQAQEGHLLEFYHLLRHFTDQRDFSLTIRQLSVLLTCYLLDEDHTVRRLAVRLRLAKPAVSRILDHLVDEGLLERRVDPRDRRSVLFEPTRVGDAFLKRMRHSGASPEMQFNRQRR